MARLFLKASQTGKSWCLFKKIGLLIPKSARAAAYIQHDTDLSGWNVPTDAVESKLHGLFSHLLGFVIWQS
jgi:hypothetical protein